MQKTDSTTKTFQFPRWSNILLPLLVLGLGGGGAYFAILVPYALNASTLNIGYAPTQPIDYSHKLHAGELGIDCTYCHNTVDEAAHAAVPPATTCWNCHGEEYGQIQWESNKLTLLKQTMQPDGPPIEWIKVHDLGDYAYFNHASHVNAGVSCVQCHGRVDQMEVVMQVENLSMGWCLECHREPEDKIWPLRQVTNLDWDPQDATEAERDEMERLRASLKPQHQLTDCSTCHR